LKLRATHGEVGLRRLEAQPPKGGFAARCPQFQLPGTSMLLSASLFFLSAYVNLSLKYLFISAIYVFRSQI